MEEGWIVLHRKTLRCVEVMKDNDHLAVWVYLLLKASHGEMPAWFGGEKITLQPGQLITGRKKIAAELKMDEYKVYRILKLFKDCNQITQQTSSKNSLISIVSWDEYQHPAQQMHSDCTATAHKQQLNNNELLSSLRSDNNSCCNSVATRQKTFDHESREYKCAVYLDKQISERLPSHKPADEHILQNWAREFDLCHRVDRRSWDEIKAVLMFSQTDRFWSKNILSGKKFRKQMEPMALKMMGGSDGES